MKIVGRVAVLTGTQNRSDAQPGSSYAFDPVNPGWISSRQECRACTLRLP